MSEKKGKAKGSSPNSDRDKKRGQGLCRRWNSAGKCRFGDNCHFEHHCAICGKSGHGAVTCMRRCPEKADKATPKKET